MKVKAIRQACGKSLVSALALLTACTATTPADRHDRMADGLLLDAAEMRTAGFRHRLYRTRASNADTDGEVLFVYFGGDGTPFVRPDAVARDPTPRSPLTLTLLATGPRPAVFVGRPCYHAFTRGCTPELWTIGRYSEPVVASMAEAVDRLVQDGGHESAVLIGYSGGGALAVLVAERLPAVHAVVTLAANLDLAAWTGLHGYTPLATSIDPATVAGGRDDLAHLHVTGSLDETVPPRIHNRLRARLPGGAFLTLPGYDHRCCWARDWPGLLDGVVDQLER